ncbi:MAG: hypothetical protein GZ086_06865 [Gelidibacter sp.]|nr:hypothetical protein [Gelidibacter sp.]
MKKVIIFFLVLALPITALSQQTKTAPTLTKQDYLQKSKNQKKTAWMMVGGGTVLLITGLVIPKGEFTGYESIYGIPGYERYKNDDIKAAFVVTGILSSLGSIPLFIASGKNKKRAMNATVYFEIQQNSVLTNTGITFLSSPTLTTKINF